MLMVVFSTVMLSSCDESSPETNGDDSNSWSELKGNVVVLNEQAAQYVDSYQNDSIIQFSSSTPENLVPREGTIIYVPESERTPYGFLGKIIKIEKSNGYKVFTETAPLDEVFGNLSVDGTLESINGIEEVLDAEGNPLEYEIVDSLFQETGTKASVASRTGEFYLKDKLIKFPFNIYSGEAGDKSIKLSGNVYAGFKNFNLSIDINNNSTSYVDLHLTPCVGLNATSKVKLAGGKKEIKDILIGKMTLRATIPTPAGIPIIVPITLYVYGTCGASGEITATLSFKPEYSTNWNVKYKTGQWSCDKKDSPARNPWEASNFEVKGEIYSGTKLGVLVGLYSATSGIGINIIPNYSIGCSASIAAENILNINPLVDQTLKISSEAYCVAKFFGKQLAKATFQFPDYILWNEKVYLLPQYSDFNAIGNGSHGEISYKIDQHYFLKFLGFKHGLTIFDSNKTTEIETAYPSASNTDNRGFTYHNYSTKELSGGRTYYASPTIYGLNRKFHGEKHEFSTEASYHAGFRCSGQSYDNIYFDFYIKEDQSSTLDQTLETQDYDGDLERIHFTAQYNATTKQLVGVIDYHFYDNPEVRRQDGFTISLPIEDTGYIYCNKVIDNGGCDKMVRVYRNNSSAAKIMKYDRPIVVTNCSVGDH